jgi:hypothetical protein
MYVWIDRAKTQQIRVSRKINSKLFFAPVSDQAQEAADTTHEMQEFDSLQVAHTQTDV